MCFTFSNKQILGFLYFILYIAYIEQWKKEYLSSWKMFESVTMNMETEYTFPSMESIDYTNWFSILTNWCIK